MNIELKFYKENTGRWYVDLPTWEGSKNDLEMVSGADTMLEIMSENTGEVTLYMSDVEYNNADKLEFIRLATEIDNGAFYIMKQFQSIEFNLEMWLCDVTKFVFNDFPKTIYITKIK